MDSERREVVDTRGSRGSQHFAFCLPKCSFVAAIQDRLMTAIKGVLSSIQDKMLCSAVNDVAFRDDGQIVLPENSTLKRLPNLICDCNSG